MSRGEFKETSGKLGCPGKRRQAAKPGANRGIDSCLGPTPTVTQRTAQNTKGLPLHRSIDRH